MPRWTRQLEDLISGKRRSLVISGECREVMSHLPDGVADVCVVDPPYGVDWRGVGDRLDRICNDRHPHIWFLGDLYRVMAPNSALACFHVERLQHLWQMAIEAGGFTIHNQVIWDKERPGMGDTARQFAPRDERAWIASKGRWRLPNGRPSNIFRCPMIPPRSREHSCQKPLPVLDYLIRHLGKAGSVVIDPTMGSGSTGVAAVHAGYRFIGIEMDPAHVAVARRRLQEAEAQTDPDAMAKLVPTTHACYAGTPTERAVA